MAMTEEETAVKIERRRTPTRTGMQQQNVRVRTWNDGRTLSACVKALFIDGNTHTRIAHYFVMKKKIQNTETKKKERHS